MIAERPLAPWDVRAGHPGITFLTGGTAFFALARDPRFSYCLYVPTDHTADGPPLPLVITVHGLPVHLVIGENYTDAAGLAPDDERRPVTAGSNRLERIHALHANWREHGIDARLDIVPGTGHHHFAVLPAVRRFLAPQVSASPRPRPPKVPEP
ncbi:hypothetical protein [Streptomyces olindensis]|uniref:hypothetical protein n=1 Tax=Streptomyces olindensis TaxID=358823 RepID=UPI0004A0196E|nr:hypothetical protein DF19_38610 [Streptomyces olindensis]